MEGHFLMFSHVDDPDTELLRVYPVELARMHVPKASDQTQNINGVEVTVMKMEYSVTECIVNLRQTTGTPILIDAVPTILQQEHEFEDIQIRVMPADIVLQHLDLHDANQLKQIIYSFFPSIEATHKYGTEHIIDVSAVYSENNRQWRPTVHAEILQVPEVG
jgi:hypothetical protein